MNAAASPTSYGVIPLADLKSMSGLEFLQGIVSGKLPSPPISRIMGFGLGEVAPGFACFTCTPTYDHYNPIGSVHGGLAGTMLDSCMSCAVQTTLDKGFGYTTLEYRVHLVRGITDKTGPLRAEGRVVHGGKKVATAEGKIIDASGALYAHGTATCLIFQL